MSAICGSPLDSSSRAARLVLALAVVAVVLVGCSHQPPAPGAYAANSATMLRIPSTTSTRNSAVTVLETLEPCQLLTAQDVGQFDANAGRRTVTGASARDCQWLVTGGGGVFGITLRSRQGLRDLDAGIGTLSDQRVGVHSGKLLREFDGVGTCAIIVEITESSRVDVSSVANTDTEKACRYVSAIAVLIEPRLPRNR